MRLPVLMTLALAIAVACSSPTALCACSQALPSALVFGVVRVATGAPIREASISASAKPGSCPGTGPTVAASFGAALSDSTGRFRLVIAPPTLDGPVCVQLSARRPGAALADSLVSSPVTVTLRNGGSTDSTRVDINFP